MSTWIININKQQNSRSFFSGKPTLIVTDHGAQICVGDNVYFMDSPGGEIRLATWVSRGKIKQIKQIATHTDENLELSISISDARGMEPCLYNVLNQIVSFQLAKESCLLLSSAQSRLIAEAWNFNPKIKNINSWLDVPEIEILEMHCVKKLGFIAQGIDVKKNIRYSTFPLGVKAVHLEKSI